MPPQASYLASFDRIGRHHRIAPLAVTGTEREIEDQILRYARPRLGSQDVDVLVDVQGGHGVVLVGAVRRAGLITLTAAPASIPQETTMDATTPQRAGGHASVDYLAEYNSRRARTAAEAQITRARAALTVLGDRVNPVHAETAQLRIDHPHESLTQLARRLGVSKDVVAGRLRQLTIEAARATADAGNRTL
jgi:hypothetical protein